MRKTRSIRKIDSPRSPRAQRSDAAVVAQYIYELSSRHGGPGNGRRARVRPVRIPCGPDLDVQPQGA